MKFIARFCIKGLAAILPLALTIYLLYWIGSNAESILAPLLKKLLPAEWYVAGMGVVFGLAVVFLIGALMTTWLARWLLSLGEHLVDQIPVVKTVYGAIKDTMAMFGGGDDKKQLNQVVLVRFGDEQTRVLGFLTRDNVADIVDRDPDGVVAVYLPMSYQIGGFTVLVRRSAIEPVDMTGEAALRFAVTAGMSSA